MCGVELGIASRFKIFPGVLLLLGPTDDASNEISGPHHDELERNRFIRRAQTTIHQRCAKNEREKANELFSDTGILPIVGK